MACGLHECFWYQKSDPDRCPQEKNGLQEIPDIPLDAEPLHVRRGGFVDFLREHAKAFRPMSTSVMSIASMADYILPV